MAVQDGASARTEFDYDYANAIFSISPDGDSFGIRPSRRQYTLCFIGATDVEGLDVEADGVALFFEKRYDRRRNTLIIELGQTDSGSRLKLQFRKPLALAHNPVQDCVFDLLDQMNIGYEEKEAVYRCVSRADEPWRAISELQAMELSQDVVNAISEVLLAE